MRNTLLLFSILPLFLFSQNDKVINVLNKFQESEAIKHATVSLLVSDLKTGKKLVALNSERSVIPASTLKLLTTASALEVLGKDFQFETQLAYDGKLSEGILRGNLHIIGGGDPALGSSKFGQYYTQPHFLDVFVNAVKKAGIKQITGRLIADASLYGKYQTPPTWTWEDMGNYWGAQPHALSIYDNSYTAYFNSSKIIGEKTVIASVDQKELPIEFDNRVVASSSRRDNAYIFGAPFQKERYVLGDIPKSRKLFSVKGSIPEPPKYLADLLSKKLKDAGIKLNGKTEARYKANPLAEPKAFFNYPSPNLQMIVLTTNLRSVNLYAEHIMRQIGVHFNANSDLSKALTSVKEFWTEKGMDTNGMILYDGSGLSHYNVVTAEQMVFLLRYMATTSNNNFSFRNSLPVMGKSGTLKYMGRGTNIANKVKAKSGSLDNVRSYAGYITTQSNNELAFFISVNHYTGTNKEIKDGIVTLLSKIVETL